MAIKKRDAQELLSLAYKHTFSTPEGQKVLIDIAKSGRLFSSCFNKDPYITAFNEGERNVMLRIISYLDMDLEKYRQMVKDSQTEEYE